MEIANTRKKYTVGKVLNVSFKLVKIKLSQILNLSHLKLRWKFIGMAMLVGVIPIIIVSVYNIAYSTQTIEESILDRSRLYGEMANERLNTYFVSREIDALTLVQSKDVRQGLEVLNTFRASHDEMEKIEADFKELLKIPVLEYGITDVFFTNKYGEVIYSLNYDKLDLAPLVFSQNFMETAMDGQQNWSTLFRNSFLDENILVLSTPIKSYENQDRSPIGTLNMVINQETLTGLVHQGISSLGINGDAYIINGEGLLVTDTMLEPYNKDAALVESLDTEVVQLLGPAITKGSLEFNTTKTYMTYSGQEVIGTMFVTKVGDMVVGMVTEVETNEVFGVVGDLKRTLTIISAAVLALSLFIAIIISLSISNPIERIIKVINKISNFELNSYSGAGMDYSRKDEIGDIYRAVVTISENFIALLKEVDRSAEDVVISSNDLHKGAVMSLDMVSLIENEVKEIAITSSNQMESAEVALRNTKGLNLILSDNKKELESVVAFISEVAGLVHSGLRIIQELNDTNEQTCEINKKLLQTINKSLSNYKHIEGATKLISDIADKTNLLSLNASIEAARAGEHGLGFSVVASEIRDLATQAKNSSRQINSAIKGLKYDYQSVENSIEDMIGNSEIQEKSIQASNDKYYEINHAMGETHHLTEKLIDIQKKIDNMRIELEDKMLSLSGVSEQNAVSSKNVEATLEKQVDISNSIVVSSQKLDGLSKKLKKEVGKFQY